METKWDIIGELYIVTCACVHAKSLSCVWLFATLRTVAHQAPLPTEFSRQEYCSVLPCPPPGYLPDPGIELTSLTSPAGRFFTTSATHEVLSSVQFSRSVMSNSLRPRGLYPTRLHCPQNSPGKNTGVGCYEFLQGIFLIQGSNLGLPHCRQILYHLSHQGSHPSLRRHKK